MQFKVLFDKIVTRAGYIIIEANDETEANATFNSMVDEGVLETSPACYIKNPSQIEYETYWTDMLR